MNKDEYVIINRTKLQQKIEELEKELIEIQFKDNVEVLFTNIGSRLNTYKEVLSNSIELIPEIEKAFDEGKEAYLESTFSNSGSFYNEIKEDYIKQLTLNI